MVKSGHERSEPMRPPRSGETSSLGSMDPVAGRDQVRAAWWKEKQDEVGYGSLVEPQNQGGAGAG
jgi:hypothetical protein